MRRRLSRLMLGRLLSSTLYSTHVLSHTLGMRRIGFVLQIFSHGDSRETVREYVEKLWICVGGDQKGNRSAAPPRLPGRPRIHASCMHVGNPVAEIYAGFSCTTSCEARLSLSTIATLATLPMISRSECTDCLNPSDLLRSWATSAFSWARSSSGSMTHRVMMPLPSCAHDSVFDALHWSNHPEPSE